MKFRQLLYMLLTILTIWNGPGQFALGSSSTFRISNDSSYFIDQIDEDDEFLDEIDETMLLPQKTKNKQKLRKRMIIVGSVIAVIAASYAGFYFYDQHQQNKIKEQAIQGYYSDPDNKKNANSFKHNVAMMVSKNDSIEREKTATSQKLNQDIEGLKQEIENYRDMRKSLIAKVSGKDDKTFHELNGSIGTHDMEEKMQPISKYLDTLAEAANTESGLSVIADGLKPQEEAALAAVDEVLQTVRVEREKLFARNNSQSYSRQALQLGKLFFTSMSPSGIDKSPQFELSAEMRKISDHLTSIKGQLKAGVYSERVLSLEKDQILLRTQAENTKILIKKNFTIAPKGLRSGPFCIESDEINKLSLVTD